MRIVWKILNRLLLGIVSLVVLLVVWFIISSFYDEPLDPSFNQFFYTDTLVPNEQNGYLALSGIDAPNEAQMIEYGLTVAKRYKQKPEKYTYIINKPNATSLNCWISNKSNPDKSTKSTCLTTEQLTKVLEENAVFFKNYQNLYHYKRFQSATQLAPIFYGSDLISLHELFMAKLVLGANQGKAEDSLGSWIADTQFIQRLMTDKTSMVQKSIFLVLYSINLNAYSLIASHVKPEQIARYRPQLHAIFDTPAFGDNGLNVAATMRWEKEALLPLIEYKVPLALYKPQATRNGLYEFARDLVKLSEGTTIEIAEKSANLKEKYNRNRYKRLYPLLYNPIGTLALSSIYVYQDLLFAANYNYSRRQLLKLYTEALAAHIPADKMKQFVAASTIRNPLTNLPFEYDEANQIIRVIGNSQNSFEVYYGKMLTPAARSTPN